MNRDTLYSMFPDGPTPSNKRANGENPTVAPIMHFIKALCDEFRELVPKERMALTRATHQLSIWGDMIDIGYAAITFDRAQVEAGFDISKATLSRVARRYIEIYQGGDAANPEKIPDDIGPFDGDPAQIVEMVIAHIMESDDSPLVTDNQLLMAESALRAIAGMDEALALYIPIDQSQAQNESRNQIKWAIRGLIAGAKAAILGGNVPAPEYSTADSFAYRLDVSNFKAAAPPDGIALYDDKIGMLHRAHERAVCEAAYRKFAQIGVYVAQNFLNHT